MRKLLIVLLCVIIGHYQLRSQVFPKEGSTLNYRLIGFVFPATQQTGNCKLEIAIGNYNSEEPFKKKLILSLPVRINKIIAKVPAFGSQYTWRIVSRLKSRKQTGFHHFSTAIIPNVDTTVTRLRISKKAEAYKDAYVFVDGTRTLYDMNGNPVWFLPNIGHFDNENFEVRDMKLTPQGTITFIIGDNAYEVNYNADILWKAPNNGKISGDFSEAYHHQVTRLANGHYMILGSENVVCRLPSPQGSLYKIIGDDTIGLDKNYQYLKLPFGTVIEYDENGNVVWSWKSAKYFKGSDIIYHKNSYGFPEVTPHENGFYFDEKTKTIYISFRNISRILKVKYPEGNVLNTYGEIFKPGVPEKGNGLFCNQHSCKISKSGDLYLFNNNVCHEGAFPTIIVMREPTSENGDLKKIWEYECKMDNLNDSEKKVVHQFLSGGNVTELPDHSFFASMWAATYGKVFIVSWDKKILWSAIPEKKDPLNKTWQRKRGMYEASIITNKKDIEALIWDSQGKE